MHTPNTIEAESSGVDSTSLGVRTRKDTVEMEMEQERWKRNKIDDDEKWEWFRHISENGEAPSDEHFDEAWELACQDAMMKKKMSVSNDVSTRDSKEHGQAQVYSAQKRKADEELVDVDLNEIAWQNAQEENVRRAAAEKEKTEKRRRSKRMRERERRAKMSFKQKEEERTRERERRAKMSSKQKEEATKKKRKSRAKMSSEQKEEAKQKNTQREQVRREKMSSQQKEEATKKNTASKRKRRAKMSSQQKEEANKKDKSSKASKKKDKKKNDEQLCRGFITDEDRQLHTVWILDESETEDTLIPVAKLMIEEVIDRVHSKFVLVRSEPDEDDKRFIEEQLRRGFDFNLKKKDDEYFRFGPVTRDPVIDTIPKENGHEEVRNGGIPNDIDEETILPTSYTVGPMDKTCKFCGAKGFENEVQHESKNDDDGEDEIDFGDLCCKRGKVHGIKEYNLPPELEKLYTDQNDADAKRFREKSRLFNNGMALTSVAADKGWKSRCHNNKMSSMLTACGQLIRRIGPVQPKDGQSPKCVQCFFYGPEDAAKHRLNNSFMGQKQSKQDERIFSKLHRILISAKNKYIESFIGVRDYMKQVEVKKNLRNIVLALHANVSADQFVHKGRLNAPQAQEIALLMPNEIDANSKRLLTFNYKTPDENAGLEFIQDYHRSYDPMQYTVLFPDGQDGWHCDLDHTALEHINFMTMDRDGITNPILCGNGVGHQFILDQYCKVELDRLRWVELNQKTIHAELYSGLSDSINKSEDLKKTGKRVILPSSFLGGDRYMHQQYLDSMALFQRFGRPHLFITMTANPEWKEVQDYLNEDQTAFDRPDLIARVFKLKKQKLIKELYSGSIFGKCIARTHCIEFQKRGLPHAHILIWLTIDHIDPVILDKIICAEIPSETIIIPQADGTVRHVRNPLYGKVERMLHGPCGHINPSLSCMQNGFCKYNYPKEYVSTTELNEDGYPRYKRRSPEEGGNVFETYRNKKKHVYTNADVIPYNKYLTQRFDSHINVEWCNSISAIKYLFGYINKGSDQATVEVQTAKETDWTGTAEVEVELNEVKEYKTKRYVSVAEACWRLRQNEMAERKPAVCRLNIHLPEQQTVYYNAKECDKEEIERKIEKAKDTQLTAYFDLNKDECDGGPETAEERAFARKLLYRDIPEHYTWDSKKKKWNRRKQGINNDIPMQIARVYAVHPTETERYSLRLLLNHVRGAASFDDLKRVEGHDEPFETFHAAAVARNLVKDDHIWIECMKEESETQTNIYRLRSLFVTILLHCQVGNPAAFYDECKSDLYSNYLHKYNQEFVKHPQLKYLVDGSQPMEGHENNDPNWTLQKYAENSSLIHLQLLLSKEDHSLSSFHLPEPNMEREQYIQNILAKDCFSPASGQAFTKERAKEFFDENHSKLNKDQLHVYDTLRSMLSEYIQCVKEGTIPRKNEGSLAFLDAPGGTGKTFTLNVLISSVLMDDKLVASTAASGIAAIMLHLGRTAHNQFKLPVNNINPDSTCNINLSSDLASFLRDVLLIIIDEATMLDKWCYEALDRTLKDITGHEETKFGGKIVLVSGDFRQLLEVIPGANRAKTVGRCLKGSKKLWDGDVIRLQLKHNMRVKNALQTCPNDSEFEEQLRQYEKWLLDLGEGKLSPAYGPQENIVEIPPDMCKESEEDVIDAVFDNFDSNVGDPEYFQSRSVIAATNTIVNEINNKMTDRLPGELKTFQSIDTVGDDDNPTYFPSEFLNSLQLSGMADHEIRLKINSVVILLRNMNIDAGHCNGTRFFVKEIGEYRLVLKKLNCNGDANDYLVLPRIPMTSSAGFKLPFVLSRLQFPIKVAFALTINRSQSQTFSGKCGILLPTSVWTHGQIYVAFSRCGDPNNVFVWADQAEFKELIDTGQLPPNKKYMRNVVYREVIG